MLWGSYVVYNLVVAIKTVKWSLELDRFIKIAKNCLQIFKMASKFLNKANFYLNKTTWGMVMRKALCTGQ